MERSSDRSNVDAYSVQGSGAFVRRCCALLIIVAVVAALAHYPFVPLVLSGGLAVYATVLYFYPHAWLIALPALLPVFDLAPWSGWFFLDELDFLILLTLAIALWRNNHQRIGRSGVPAPLLAALVLLAISYLVSMVIGLLPLQPFDANAFSNYYSHYNSLRMCKGFFEAVALYLLFLSRADVDGWDGYRFVAGMTLGLATLSIVVVRERWLFPGLFDFASDFRVTATFSGLHNGGNDLEAYIVLAQPFIIAWTILRRNFISGVAALALLLLSTYALLVTFSRAELIALIVDWALLAVCLAIGLRRQSKMYLGKMFLLGLFSSVAVLSIALPVVGGSFFKARLEAAKSDWNYRLLQSRKTTEMMDSGLLTNWFGMGLGKYPEMVYLRSPLKIKPAAFRFDSEAGNQFLRLSSGSPLYFGQWLNIEAGGKYRVKFRARATAPGAVSAYLCEKTLQYSFRCASRRFELGPAESWSEKEADIDANFPGRQSGYGGWFFRRPVEFALANSSRDTLIDVDDVSLVGPLGNNLIVNGDFSRGSDRWFFTVDDHTSWQNWNHWVQIYFEQGWFGVISLGIFVLCVYSQLLKLVFAGNWLSGVALAGLSGFLIVGIFGFLFDTPRMALLFYLISLICASGLAVPSQPSKPAS